MNILKVGQYWVLYIGDVASFQFDSLERAIAFVS